ncbi:MAG TPA: acetyl-CoA carboxylase biotin carboxylase subunit [Nannocystaceae bacterium]|nr:acetyl-CoA carboxylase biotin carboxylase subunit [Nannocystaceae bacterium]
MTKPPFRKILVANRGEIALRVFRTCAEAGIATVAVYSDADRDALHVAHADEAVALGGQTAAESYLKVEKIIAAAKATGAEAIHPGYGFLSERAFFVDACDAAGIVFIGPPTRAMDVMGDKVRARKAMAEAGVPVVPGVNDLDSADAVIAAARQIGLPVMLKASAGGGGKGMRVVEHEGDLLRAYEGASREALAAFGDGRMLMERAVMRARHVEIQLMADNHGNVVYLNERDCSVQRRHQKVIEEAPSPSPQMSPAIRAQMGEVAVRAAKAVGYSGAGTVEFLFEETPQGPRFYFLEMNTRLQVEHPVTEATCGRDLVWDQIRVAAGEPLGYSQADVALRGHAIECRLYAEDPVRFLPSPGTIRHVRWPVGSGIRVDTAVASGSVVSSFYDPMIAKLTVWGPDRASAIRKMREALRSTVLLGISTNIRFHLRVLDEADFVAGHFSTRYIDEHPGLTTQDELSEAESRAIAAAAGLQATDAVGGLAAGCEGSAAVSGWRSSVRWRR